MKAPAPEYEGEREVDLARWRHAVVAWWWLPVAGLVLGALAGAILSTGGSKTYQAETLLAIGEPFAPGGGPFNSYVTNPLAIKEIIHSEAAIEEMAAKCGLSPSAVRGKVDSDEAGIGSTAATRSSSPLIAIIAQNSQARKADCLSNQFARYVIGRTTAPYVGTRIRAIKTQLGAYQEQLDALVPLIAQLEQSLSDKSLIRLDRLVIAVQLDNAQTRRGQLLGLQNAAQQQLAFAENVESAKIVQPAAPFEETPRSRRNSIVVGALIGLIIGAIAAIIVDARSPRMQAV
jgi:hypothetical protein